MQKILHVSGRLAEYESLNQNLEKQLKQEKDRLFLEQQRVQQLTQGKPSERSQIAKPKRDQETQTLFKQMSKDESSTNSKMMFRPIQPQQL